MRKKGRCKKWISILLVLTLTALTACGQGKEANSSGGSSPDSTASTEPEKSDAAEESDAAAVPQEVTNLNVFLAGGGQSEDGWPWFQEYLAGELGVSIEIDVDTTNSGKISALLASGELPDIVIMANGDDQIKNAAAGGLLLDLAQYKEQLPNVFENSVYEPGIRFYQDACDGGGVYALPVEVGREDEIYAFTTMLRYDVYREIGCPEIPDKETFLQVLKQMQEAEPETADGQKTYGLATWIAGNSNDAVWFNVARLLGGVTNDSLFGLYMVSLDGEKGYSIYDEDGPFKEALQFLFDANQMGILDPDGATMNNEEYIAKVSNGQIMYTPFSWMGANKFNTSERVDKEDFEGYAEVWPTCFTYPVTPERVIGNGKALVISADTQKVDKALEFVNWFYSEEAQSLLYNGPEGVLYETKDGERVPTDLWRQKGLAYEMPEGGSVEAHKMFSSWLPLCAGHILESTGAPLAIVQDPAFGADKALTVMDKAWREQYGEYDTMYERAKATGEGLEQAQTMTAAVTFRPKLSEDINTLRSQIVSLNSTAFWKMIYAKDQAEFDAVWTQLKADVEAAGGNEVMEAILESWEIGKERCEKYSW